MRPRLATRLKKDDAVRFSIRGISDGPAAGAAPHRARDDGECRARRGGVMSLVSC
jgi:hypothetical protein